MSKCSTVSQRAFKRHPSSHTRLCSGTRFVFQIWRGSSMSLSLGFRLFASFDFPSKSGRPHGGNVCSLVVGRSCSVTLFFCAASSVPWVCDHGPPPMVYSVRTHDSSNNTSEAGAVAASSSYVSFSASSPRGADVGAHCGGSNVGGNGGAPQPAGPPRLHLQVKGAFQTAPGVSRVTRDEVWGKKSGLNGSPEIRDGTLIGFDQYQRWCWVVFYKR